MNVFGSTTVNRKTTDTSSLVQKPYLEPTYIESIIGEDIDMENQFRFENLPKTVSIREVASN